MFIRFLFVFDLLFNLFRIALWPSVGKELSPWLLTCAVFILVSILIVGVSFSFGVYGRMWNSIVSFLMIAFLSPLHCLPFCLNILTAHYSVR